MFACVHRKNVGGSVGEFIEGIHFWLRRGYLTEKQCAALKRAKPITPKKRLRGENVVDLMEALRRSVGGAAAETKAPKSKKPRKAATGQKEMLMPIAGKKRA
jgi:hypothetical protein